MIPELRRAFNAAFTPEKYAELLRRLDAGSGTPVTFRNCETPCFFPDKLIDEMAQAGRDLLARLMNDPAYLAAARQTIPPAFRVPSEDARPLFIQVDFGLDENRRPRLVEIQGFPSLYAYQPFLADAYRTVYNMDPGLRSRLGGLDADGYEALLRRAIVGEHAPENVVLLEIEPEKQKTLPDFRLTEKMLGIPTVDVATVKKQGRRLLYTNHAGRLVPIERIYNRVIVDELVRTGARPGFDFRDELDVEWAGHPHWYYVISKFSIPHLADHPCVPRATFLDQIAALPDDLDNYVLKPLFSFAGLGVRVGPTQAEVTAIPPDQRGQYLLQERVNFAPVIETPFGPTKVEIRLLFVWPDGEPEARAVTTLLRMGRGKMMGVDQNRAAEWVGASAGFF